MDTKQSANTKQYTVSLEKIINEFKLTIGYLPEHAENILISTTEINRPGLHLSGFNSFFDPKRMQVMGKMEMAYLATLDEDLRRKRMDEFFSKKIPCVILANDQKGYPEMVETAEKYAVPLLYTTDTTSNFMSNVIAFLNVELAPRITRHGVLIEVYGEGLLMLGESGVGKSETAIELVKRGHRLIADDAVEIRRVSGKTLVGSSPENIRHFLELRGIGIINTRRLFGMGSVKVTEKIDMIIQMELWDSDKVYDRMGIDNEYFSILGIEVPAITIPVKPGRNLAIILEVAAMNNRHKKMGYNAAQELLDKLGMPQEVQKDTTVNWDLY